jgi:hypothetical protein
MIKLGTAAFNLQVAGLSTEELKEYSSKLFDLWEAQVEIELSILSDYSLRLEVEEGSLKGRGKIFAGVVLVYGAICGYGSFVQGLQMLNGHVRSAVSCLNDKSISSFSADVPKHIFKTGTGRLGKLEGLFAKARKGEITPELAAARAERMFRDEANECPEFIASFLSALHDQKEVPQQIDLLSDLPEFPAAVVERDLRPGISSGKTPSAPPQDKYKVEVWRDSKRKKRYLEIIKIQ